MTGGAAYDLCQTVGWKYGLSKRPSQAKHFYRAVAAFTLIAVATHFMGINSMKALVVSDIVQGFSLMQTYTIRSYFDGELSAIDTLHSPATAAVSRGSGGCCNMKLARMLLVDCHCELWMATG